MINPVKELGDIKVRHPFFARLNVFLRRSNRLVLASPSPKCVAVLTESWVEDPLEQS